MIGTATIALDSELNNVVSDLIVSGTTTALARVADNDANALGIAGAVGIQYNLTITDPNFTIAGSSLFSQINAQSWERLQGVASADGSSLVLTEGINAFSNAVDGATVASSDQLLRNRSLGDPFVFDPSDWSIDSAGASNLRTGLAWFDEDYNFAFDSVTFDSQVVFSPVPEPTSALLAALGGVCFFARRRRSC